MHVAYICADPGVPAFGHKGSSVHVQAVLRSLLRRGARVELLAARLDGSPPPGLEDLRVHPLPRPPKGDAAARERAALAANAQLGDRLRELGDLDLVYERCSLWSHAALEAGAPSVLEVNAPLVDEQERHRVLVDRAGAERVADRQAAAASAIVAVSAGVADHLCARHPAAAARVHVLANGVDPERFPPGPARSSAAPFTVGFVGTLKPWHGLAVLAEAFARLRAAGPRARLLVVGDGPERPALEAALLRLGVRHAATLTGAVAPAAVPRLMAEMDVAVAPYPPLEPFYFSPLKVVEALAAGLPVVASRLGRLADLVRDGGTGLLVPPGDPDALAAALARLAADPEWRRRLGRAGRAEVLEHHTWDAVVARMLDLVAPARLVEAA